MQCRRSRVSEASAISMSSWWPPETGGAGRIVATLEGSASVGGEQVLGLGEELPGRLRQVPVEPALAGAVGTTLIRLSFVLANPSITHSIP